MNTFVLSSDRSTFQASTCCNLTNKYVTRRQKIVAGGYGNIPHVCCYGEQLQPLLQLIHSKLLATQLYVQSLKEDV